MLFQTATSPARGMPPKGGGPKPRGARRNTTTTTMTADTLHTLARMTQPDLEWTDAIDYFMTEIMEENDDELAMKSSKCHIDIVYTMITQMSTTILQKTEITIAEPRMFRTPEYHLIYGTALAEGNQVCFFYLTHIHAGVFAFVDPRNQIAPKCIRVHAIPMDLDAEAAEQKLYTEPYNRHPN